MKPRSGENPPLSKSSRSQTWRGDKSQEGHSREWLFNSEARSGLAIKSTSSPPCGGMRWLVEAVKSLTSQVRFEIFGETIPFLFPRMLVVAGNCSNTYCKQFSCLLAF